MTEYVDIEELRAQALILLLKLDNAISTLAKHSRNKRADKLLDTWYHAYGEAKLVIDRLAES